MKKLIALMCMFLIAMLPLNTSVVLAQEDGGTREEAIAKQTFEQIGKEVAETAIEVKEPGTPFEDILVQVDSYQPTVLRAGLLEEQNVLIYASLIGVPSNPTITIPRINDFQITSQNVSWDPVRKPEVKLGGSIRYIPPAQGFIDFRNLGYLAIPINKIPKEHDVPDSVNIDLTARISFDISETVTMSRKDLVLPALTEGEWLGKKDDFSFYGGYLRAEQIDEKGTTLFLYDNRGGLVRVPIRLNEGQTSGLLSAYGGGIGAPTAGLRDQFYRFRIRLNEIRGVEDQVGFMIQKPEAHSVKLVRGNRLYPESNWVVENLIFGDKDAKVLLKNTVAGGSEEFILSYTKVKPTSEDAWNRLSESEQEQLYNAALNLIFEDKMTEVQKQIYVDELKLILIEPAKKTKEEVDKLYNEGGIEKLEFEAGIGGTASAKDEAAQKIAKQSLLESEELAALESQFEYPEEQKRPAVTEEERNFDKFVETFKINPSSSPTGLFDSYANAIAYYEQVVEEADRTVNVNGYSGNLAQQAKQKIAEIYSKLGFIGRQTEIESELAGEDPVTTNARLIRQKLKDLGDTSTLNIRTKILNDVGGEITVTVTEVVKAGAEQQPKARIVVDGSEREVSVGESFVIGDINYKVTNILNNEFSIEVNGKPERVGYNPKSVDVKSTVKSKTVLQLKRTDFKRVAYVSILPETKRAFSETKFKLHIPVERRHIGLPLFSSSLDKEINKTAKLIDKLDHNINQLEKLHKFWTNLCFITFGTLWAKNLLAGVMGTGAVVRNKINPEWKQKYSEAQANENYKGSYSQYLSENLEEYNKDYKETEAIIKEIDEGKYKTSEATQGLGDDKEVDAFKRDLHYSYRKAQENPDDPVLARNYVANDLRAQEMKTNARVAQLEGQNWRAIEGHDKEELDAVVKKTYPNEDSQTVWENPAKRTKVLGEYREAQIRYTYNEYDENAALKRVNSKENKAVSEYVQSQRNLRTQTDEKTEVKVNHEPQVTRYEEGKYQGKIKQQSIDAFNYVEYEYTTGGRIKEATVYRRSKSNGPMGGEGDQIVGELNNVRARSSDNPELQQALGQAINCATGMNSQLANQQKRVGEDVIAGATYGCALGRYTLTKSIAPVSGPNCEDYMSPEDCRMLYNACDPVICPASRCNFGGKWQVDNVVETGIVGSAVLCLPNFPDVVMPICITGILAGLQNIRSILQGYNQCLKTSQLEDKSVGVCDRLRSFYLCEMLWREGMAIMNTKQGLFGLLIDKISGATEGGGEYSSFSNAVDSSVGAVEFFTQNYAKNVFAGYAGAGFTEAGTEICKAAIYGKAPKVGELLSSVSKPESPPQFTAFFDAVPYSDVDRFPQSLYTIFYHVYAGENEDVTYSVFLRGTPVPGAALLKPVTVVANRKIDAGSFESQNLEQVLPEGFTEVCITTTTATYGTKQDCGPGRVTTDFGINWLSEKYIQSQATKQINSEKECVPEDYGTITGEYKSTGPLATQTGIVRTCSMQNPGVGTGSIDWARVGECGKDEQSRDLGSCWLYKPSAKQALQQQGSRDEIDKVGAYTVGQDVAVKGLDEALAASTLSDTDSFRIIKDSILLSEEGEFGKGLDQLRLVIKKSLNVDIIAVVNFEIGNLYFKWGDASSKAVNKVDKEDATKKSEPMKKDSSDSTELIEAVVGAYIQQSSDNKKMSDLLKIVGDLSKKEVRYAEGAGPLSGLNIPKINRFSLNDVKDLEGFMELLFDSKEVSPSYAYEITEAEIIIKGTEVWIIPQEANTKHMQIIWQAYENAYNQGNSLFSLLGGFIDQDIYTKYSFEDKTKEDNFKQLKVNEMFVTNQETKDYAGNDLKKFMEFVVRGYENKYRNDKVYYYVWNFSGIGWEIEISDKPVGPTQKLTIK